MYDFIAINHFWHAFIYNNNSIHLYQSQNRLPHVHRTGMMCNTRAMTVTHILHDLRGLHFRPRILRGHHGDHNLRGNYYLRGNHASQWLLNLTTQNPRIRRCRENHSIAVTDLYNETFCDQNWQKILLLICPWKEPRWISFYVHVKFPWNPLIPLGDLLTRYVNRLMERVILYHPNFVCKGIINPKILKVL